MWHPMYEPPYFPPNYSSSRSGTDFKEMMENMKIWEIFLEEHKKKDKEHFKKEENKKSGSGTADWFLLLVCFLTIAQLGYFYLAIQLVKAIK